MRFVEKLICGLTDRAAEHWFPTIEAKKLNHPPLGMFSDFFLPLLGGKLFAES